MKTKALRPFEASVTTYQSRQPNISEDLNLRQHRCKKHKPRQVIFTSTFRIALRSVQHSITSVTFTLHYNNSPLKLGEWGLQDRLISTSAAVHSSMKSSCEELGLRLRDLQQWTRCHTPFHSGVYVAKSAMVHYTRSMWYTNFPRIWRKETEASKPFSSPLREKFPDGRGKTGNVRIM